MRIRDWPLAERPRERLLSLGASGLSDAELLAIMLRSGLPGSSAVDKARQLLCTFGDLRRLLDAERARAEQPSAAWTSTASEKGDTIILVLKPATAVARPSKNQREADQIIAFTEDGWFDTDKPQTILLHSDGTLTITLIKADAYLGSKPPKTLRVIVRNDEGWLQSGKLRCLQIAPKIVRE